MGSEAYFRSEANGMDESMEVHILLPPIAFIIRRHIE